VTRGLFTLPWPAPPGNPFLHAALAALDLVLVATGWYLLIRLHVV
jgi:hypothetical protein